MKVVWGTRLKSSRLGLQPINSRRWLENRDLSKHNLIILHKVLYLRRYLSNEAFLIYPNHPYVMIPRNNKPSFKVTQKNPFSFLSSSLLFSFERPIFRTRSSLSRSLQEHCHDWPTLHARSWSRVPTRLTSRQQSYVLDFHYAPPLCLFTLILTV